MSRPKTARNKKLVEFVDKGHTFAEAAAKFGCTRQTAHAIYKREKLVSSYPQGSPSRQVSEVI